MSLRKIKNTILNVMMASVICVGLTWAFDRDPPHDYSNVVAISGSHFQSGRPVPPAHPGGVLTIRYDLSRERLCPLRIERTITDSEHTLHILGSEPYTPTETGEFSMNRLIRLDENINTGPATAKIDLFWYCNPMQSWFSWPIHTTLYVPFAVVRKP